ncbi:hypothetical protein CDAR_390941 [Caerostris darwini]|uniref:Uncharacterized protein n=1 Tax=Caerostris darwini TaxID=1538125 RepID=A0AAV4UAG1_9ARAC|nr:hypothetical protein CDAR_390941 [Caerostris darwini]
MGQAGCGSRASKGEDGEFVKGSTEKLIESIRRLGPIDTLARKPKRGQRQGGRVTLSHQRCKRRFDEVQRMWDLIPDKLAELVRDGEGAKASRNAEVAFKHFKDLYETPNDQCVPLDFAKKSQ